MKKYFFFIRLCLVALILTQSTAYAFSDVNPAHYGFEAINRVNSRGIISGYPDDTFRPDAPVTRAEMAVLMCRTDKNKVNSLTLSFPDVPENHWAKEYIEEAMSKKIITGDDAGFFRPDDFVTYEEALKMTLMATGKAKSIGTYPSRWSDSFKEIADTCKITENLKAKPGEKVNRGDVAVMIDNSLEIADNANYVLFADHIYNSDQNIPTNASFAMDMSAFAKDNSVFNKEIAKASSILSMTAYTNTTLKGKANQNADRLLKTMGFENIQKIDLQKEFTDNHITKIYLGNKLIETPEGKTRVICVVIKGTDGSKKEWASNFDIGDGEKNNEYTPENHRGHDITAQRVLEKINSYTALFDDSSAKNALWITGHSRGGSIANICGSKLTNMGEKCFVYTFGASMTTTSSKANKYDCIFNFTNTDDLITHMPLKTWGFTVYGKSIATSVDGNLLESWKKSTGLSKYKFKSNALELVDKISKFAPSRKSCYEFRNEGKVSVGIDLPAAGETYFKNLMAFIPAEASQYISYEIKKAPKGSETAYVIELNMQPAFYLQTIAAVISGKINAASLMLIPIPEYMEDAYTTAMSAYSAGIVHPHTPETYYVIVKNQ